MGSRRPRFGIGHTPEVVRSHTEAVLRRVVVAGVVAQAVWRLVLADRTRQRVAQLELGRWRDGVLPELAANAARRRIDFDRRHAQPPEVYLQAVYAAAGAGDPDPDLAGLTLADLASLHLRLGYPDDCRRLVELAAADNDLSDHARRVLAVVRAWAADYEQRTHDINADHDEEEWTDDHD